MSRRVVFCCDAGRSRGVGHVMRCIGLAEELALRGFAPLFVTAVGELEWVQHEITRRGFGLLIGDADADSVLALAPAVAIIDAYDMPASVSKVIHAAGVPVVAIVDDGDGGHEADLYINQNPGAAARESTGKYLAGLRYALLRDDVIEYRPDTSALLAAEDRLRVLAFFGGTDPMGAAPIVASALVACGVPISVTMVAANDALAARVADVPVGADQHIEVIEPTSRLAELVAGADLVVCAAGTSLWEVLCLGRPAAVLCVVDNQRIGYDQVVARGLAAGLGLIGEARDMVATLTSMLTDADLRQRYAGKAWATVDGRGRGRVADEIETLIS